MDDIPWWANGNTLLFCIKQEKQKEVGKQMALSSLDIFNILLCLGFFWLCIWLFLDWCRKNELTRSEIYWLIAASYFLGPFGWLIWARFRKRKRKRIRNRPDKDEEINEPVQTEQPNVIKKRTKEELIGIKGESDIVAILEGIPSKQAILRNVYLPHPTDRGAFTEIDILYIDSRGIVIVESKNFDGVVYLNRKEREWTYYSNGQKYSFFNPIWQNKLHTRALELVLPRKYQGCIHPVVVFGNQSIIIETVPDKHAEFDVLNTSDLEEHLERQFKGYPLVINDRGKAELLRALTPYLNASEERKAAHIQYIQNNHLKD